MSALDVAGRRRSPATIPGYHAGRRGETALPEISEPLLVAAGRSLATDDLPLLDMLIHRTAPAEIAATLRVERGELDRRIAAMLDQLKVPVAVLWP